MVDDMMMGQSQYGSVNNSGYSNISQGLGGQGIKLRLDMKEMLQDIDLYLRNGKIVTEEDDKGNYKERVVVVGEPLANEEGIQNIMGYLRLTLGAHNVQGNLTWERYDNLVFEIHVDIIRHLMINRRNWGVKIESYDLIINNIMHTVQLYLSRTVDNKERESYGQSMRTEERSVLKPSEKKGFWSGVFS